MDNSVTIKGSKSGITLILSPEPEFEVLLEMVGEKIAESAKFLGNAKTAVSFEGREITEEEENRLLNCIRDNSKLDVLCVLNRKDDKEKIFEKAVDNTIMDISAANAKFYKGSLRSGQSLTMETSIIILGDVNPGANVVSNGNIIVMGSLKGNAFAGASGNRNCFVICLDMNPMQIRIADIIARAPDKPDKNAVKETKIAYLENDSICIAPLSKEIMNNININ